MYGYLSQFNTTTETFVHLTPRPEPGLSINFAPEVLQETVPADALRSRGVHVLWEKRLEDDNVGHLVWEDLYHIWLSLRVFHTPTRPVQVLNVGEACTGLCAKMSAGLLSAVMGKALEPFDEWAEGTRWAAGQPADAPICFETLVVGGYASYLGHNNDLPHGSEPMLYEYRAETLRAHGLDPDKVPNMHHFLLVNKESSNRGTLRNIANLKEVEGFLRATYPDIHVSVVDWQHMSLQNQFEVLMSTTVAITPAGGGSMLLPFLPLGAHAIIMDYWLQEWDGTNKSQSMDDIFWNRWPHIKNDYYLVNSAEQHVMNEDCATRTAEDRCYPRDSARVKIDVLQLKVLIDGALAEMGSLIGIGQKFQFRRRRLWGS